MTIRCRVHPDSGHQPFDADFLAVPRVGDIVDAGLRLEDERLTFRVVGVIHTVGPPEPSIDLYVTSRELWGRRGCPHRVVPDWHKLSTTSGPASPGRASQPS